jgi:hypothetical protein
MIDALKEIFLVLWYILGIVGVCYLLYCIITTPFTIRAKKKEMKQLGNEIEECLKDICEDLSKIIDEEIENLDKKNTKKKTPKK